MNARYTSAMHLALKSKQMNEKSTESAQGRDSGNSFANFTREPSAIHTGKRNGACLNNVDLLLVEKTSLDHCIVPSFIII